MLDGYEIGVPLNQLLNHAAYLQSKYILSPLSMFV